MGQRERDITVAHNSIGTCFVYPPKRPYCDAKVLLCKIAADAAHLYNVNFVVWKSKSVRTQILIHT